MDKEIKFQDHFSMQADIYAQARPTYPTELLALWGDAETNKKCIGDLKLLVSKKG
jgi:hypothetical protein